MNEKSIIRIGSTIYPTLEEAQAAWRPGDVIKITTVISEGVTYSVGVAKDVDPNAVRIRIHPDLPDGQWRESAGVIGVGEPPERKP